MIKKIFFIVLFMGISACNLASANDKVILQLRWDHQFQFAGYYAAQWNGYYEEEGIDVDIKSAVTPKKILSAVEEVGSGRADFGVGAADILIAKDKGIPLVI
ncbi:MAG: ABC transporter substrate-binding protein [Desulfamplus sp.]|nr:ABC transporter substrate-binding protein [Desulfamplus sp.]